MPADYTVYRRMPCAYGPGVQNPMGAHRCFARSRDGRLHCIFVYRLDGASRTEVWYAYSDNNGQTWTTEIVEAVVGQWQEFPTLAVDSQNNVHVAWEGRGWGANPGIFNIQYRKRTTEGWQPREPVTDEVCPHHYPSIAVDGDDNIHLVWRGQEKDGGIWCTWIKIYYRKRTSAGWQSREIVSVPAIENQWQYDPSIAIDFEGDIHVAWDGDGWGAFPAVRQIQYRKRTSEGWQAQEAVTNINAIQREVCIVCDTDNNSLLIWTGRGYGVNAGIYNIQYRRKTAGGWQAREAITDELSDQLNPSIGLDFAGNLHVAWWGTIVIQGIFYSIKPSGGSWSAPTAIYSTDADTYPNLITAPLSETPLKGRPKDLLCEQKKNPIDVRDEHPEFSAEFVSSGGESIGMPQSGFALTFKAFRLALPTYNEIRFYDSGIDWSTFRV